MMTKIFQTFASDLGRGESHLDRGVEFITASLNVNITLVSTTKGTIQPPGHRRGDWSWPGAASIRESGRFDDPRL